MNTGYDRKRFFPRLYQIYNDQYHKIYDSLFLLIISWLKEFSASLIKNYFSIYRN